MDIATVVGIFSGVILIAMAIVLGGAPILYIDVKSILIVLGGTAATTLIRFPLERIKNTLQVVRNAFNYRMSSPEEVIDEIVQISKKARQEGLLALESYETEDSFLEEGLQLIVDGNEAETVESILTTNIKYILQRHRDGQDILKAVGEAAPAFGMIGTLIGLVAMLANMDDVTKLGPAMAIAILTTLYGAILANLVAIPLAKKLEFRSREERLIRELTLVGLLSILNGDNPRMTETAMRAFLSRKESTEGESKPREVKAA